MKSLDYLSSSFGSPEPKVTSADEPWACPPATALQSAAPWIKDGPERGLSSAGGHCFGATPCSFSTPILPFSLQFPSPVTGTQKPAPLVPRGGPFPLFFTFFLGGLWTSVPLPSSTFEDPAEQKHSLPSPASRMVTPEGSGSYLRVRSPAAFCFPEEGRGPRQTDHRGKLTTRPPGLPARMRQALTSAFSSCCT